MQPQPQRTDSSGSDPDALRKRVCKACDRCRLKKAKCDGANPCSRCTIDNAICFFGERKKSHDKIYPKGYVEMLEQQQAQVVQALQEAYHRMLEAGVWKGPALSEATGKPLTHDILLAMGLLEKKHDGSEETVPFEEDCEKLQARMIADGAVLRKRRGSIGSDSDRSHRAQSSSHSTPTLSRPTLFKDPFAFTSSPSPATRSPAPKQRKTYPPAMQSPLHQNPPMTNNDPQLYQTEWSSDSRTMRTPLERQMDDPHPHAETPFSQLSDLNLRDFSQNALIDSPMNQEFDFADMSYPQIASNGYGMMQDFSYGAYDDQMMDFDFKSFVAAA